MLILGINPARFIVKQRGVGMRLTGVDAEARMVNDVLALA